MYHIVDCIVCLLIGCAVGIFTAALCVAAKDN